MAAEEGTPAGYLVVKVLEAAGHNSEDVEVWDTSITDAFVKVELRGGSRVVKKRTSVQKINDNAVRWDEQLALETLEGATELRMMLCREKGNGQRGSSMIAACGIYVRELLEAVPLDKYFELYKPGTGADGGFIRVSVNFLQADQLPAGVRGSMQGASSSSRRRFPYVQVGIGVALAAFAVTRALRSR